jgi:hypothetical protein
MDGRVMKWFRLYHDTVNDPKWRLVALDSGQPLTAVLAVWMSMLIHASDSSERGTLEGWDDRIAGAAIDLRGDAVSAIRQAMQGLVLDGLRLTGWEKRQRISDNIAERVKRHRNNAKKPDPGGGSGNGLDSDGHTVSRDRNGTAPLQTEDVTLHSDNVTHFPLRAQTPDTEGSVASATGADAPSEPSLKTELFGRCLVWLIAASGQTEKSLRPMIGRWIKLHGEGAVLAAIVCAQRESAVSPVGFVEGELKKRSKQHGQANGSKHERLRHAFGGAFADLVEPGPAGSGGERRQLAIGYH